MLFVWQLFGRGQIIIAALAVINRVYIRFVISNLMIVHISAGIQL